jgi:hypothetical protein
VHVLRGPGVPTQFNCRHRSFLVNLEPGGRLHGMEWCAPQEAQSVLTLHRTPGVPTARMAGLTTGDADSVSHYTPRVPYRPMRRDSQWRLSVVPPGSQTTRSVVLPGSQDQYRAGQAKKSLATLRSKTLCMRFRHHAPTRLQDSGKTRVSSRLAAASHRTGFVPQLPSGHLVTLKCSLCLHALRCTALRWTT